MKAGTIIALGLGIGLVVLVTRKASGAGASTKFKVGDYLTPSWGDPSQHAVAVYLITGVTAESYIISVIEIGGVEQDGTGAWPIPYTDENFVLINW
jgi:hypothetical protein